MREAEQDVGSGSASVSHHGVWLGFFVWLWEEQILAGKEHMRLQRSVVPGIAAGREQPLISKVMALVWVLRDLGSSAGPVSLTCEIWICFSQPSRALSSSAVVKMHKNGLDGVWHSLAFGKRCEAGLLVKGALENSKHCSDPHSWSSWDWKGPLAVTCPTPHIQEGLYFLYCWLPALSLLVVQG